MDASFKTYSGSLFEAWPCKLEQGRVVTQKVTLTVQGKPAAQRLRRTAPIAISFCENAHNLPQIGTALAPSDIAKGSKARDLLNQVKPGQIAFCIDLRTQDWLADILRLRQSCRAMTSFFEA